MDRQTLEQYIRQTYSVDPEFLWQRYPRYAVFRHLGNRKWFALIANVPKIKLGFLPETNSDSQPNFDSNSTPELDIVNLKCDPDLLDSLRSTPGIFPAYHMNKTHWLSVALDGTVDPATIKALLAHSFDLTL